MAVPALILAYLATRNLYKTVQRCEVITPERTNFYVDLICGMALFVKKSDAHAKYSEFLYNYVGQYAYPFMTEAEGYLIPAIKSFGEQVADAVEPIPYVGGLGSVIRHRTDFTRSGLLNFYTLGDIVYHTDIVRLIAVVSPLKYLANERIEYVIATITTGYNIYAGIEGSYKEEQLAQKYDNVNARLIECKKTVCSKEVLNKTIEDNAPIDPFTVHRAENFYGPAFVTYPLGVIKAIAEAVAGAETVAEAGACILTAISSKLPYEDFAKLPLLIAYVESVTDEINDKREQLKKICVERYGNCDLAINEQYISAELGEKEMVGCHKTNPHLCVDEEL